MKITQAQYEKLCAVIDRVLTIDHDGDYDLPEIHGPFSTVAEAQAYARAYRQANSIPGHDNDEPTAEENEAWSAEGWHFAIVAPQRIGRPA